MKVQLTTFWFAFLLVSASVHGQTEQDPTGVAGSCYNTDQVIGLCAGGLSKTTYQKITITLNSVQHESQTAVVGALVDVIKQDKQGKNQPVLQMLDGYFKCVSDILGISKLLLNQTTASTQNSENTQSTKDAISQTAKSVMATQDQATSAIKETFSRSAIALEKIQQMSSVDMSRSLAASKALSELSSEPAVLNKTRLEIFSKADSIDPSFQHKVLFKLFQQQGFVVDDASVQTIVQQSAKQLELVRKSPVNQWHKINAMWFSQSKTPLAHVKAAALVLIGAGAQIYSIQPFCPRSPRSNKNVIQVGAFPGVNRKTPYTSAEVLAAQSDSFVRLDKCSG